jgi:PAS domain S-box-containing protein
MPYLKRILCFVLLLVFFLSAEATASVRSVPKNVLIIFSGAPGMPAYDLVLDKIRTNLDVALREPLNLYVEFLDQSRFPDKQSLQFRLDFINRKYTDSKMDLIIAVGPGTVPLISRYATPRLDRIPTLYLDLESGLGDTPSIVRKPNTTGVVAKFDLKKTVEIALSLHPTTANIYVIAGASHNDRFYEAVARVVFLEYEDKIRVTYLSGLTMEELLEKIGSLPRDSIMIYLTFSQDTAGINYYSRGALKVISERSKVPIYGIYDSYIGHGIVGGYVSSIERIGAKAGKLALRILRGEHPDTLPVIQEGLNLYMFDRRELKRWGIKEKNLPPGSIVKYKKFSVWDLYRWYIIGGILFVILETMVVAFLVGLIKKQKRVEERLRLAEARYKTVADYTYDWEYWVNPDGAILYMSPSVERITGYTSQEFVENPSLRWEIIVPEDRRIWDRHYEEERTNAKPYEIQFRIHRKDGQVFWIEHACQPVTGLSGEFGGLRVGNRDITLRKEAEQALQESQEKYRVLYENAPAAYFSVSAKDGTILSCNATAANLLGYEKEDLLKIKVFDLYGDQGMGVQDAKKVFSRFQQGEVLRDLELQMKKKDGSPLWIRLSIDPLKDINGNVVESRSVVMDISDRKRAEAEAFRARTELLRVERSSRLGELVASLAHELNQPLAAILSSAQAALRFLQSATPDLNLFRTILQNIVHDDKRAAGVITSLRSLVKREEREKEPLNINEVLRDVLALFRSEAIIRNVKIKTDFDSSLPSVRGDKIQLEQVVLNLVMNAAEAMSEMPHEEKIIILRTQATDQGIQVVVRDSGPGINPAKLDDIWQPFFTTKSTGLGMGLSVSSSIIRAHEGRIWAENNPDGGATFFFELPLTMTGNQ